MKKLHILICILFFNTIIFAQPSNDNCTNAQTVTSGNCVSGTTVGANDSWQGSVGCQSGGNHPDVWYTFVSTGSQAQFTITTSAPWTGNVELVLVQGTCATGFSVIGTSCGPSPLNPPPISGLQPGTTYYYTISNTNGGTPGPFQSCLTTTSPPTIAGQDCSNAAMLCNSTTFSQPTSNAGFGTQEVSPANSCWGVGGERQSKWFKFTIGCSGTLEFNLNPLNSNDDYDWALWDVTAGCATKGNSIACNWSGCTGSTGISTCIASEPGVKNCGAATGGDPCGGGSQPRAWGNWSAPGGGASTCNTSIVNVVAGNTYALLVDNFTISNSGFTLTFGGACNGGTAKIGPNADFTSSQTGCLSYNFTKTCPTSNSGFLWQFGDGVTASTQNASHTYATAGTYVVTLQVTDALGCIATFSETINISGPSVLVNSPTICVGQSTTVIANSSIGGGTYSWSPGGQASQSITVSPASTTNYVVTYSLGGCSSSATSTVTVTAAPTVLVNSPTICAGQSGTLTANPSVGGGTYSWSPGGQMSQSITVSPASTTNYVVTYSLGGCSSSATSTVTVTAAPTVLVNSPTICAGQSTTLTANPSVGGGTYSWTPGGQTSQSITVSPASTTNYVVTYSLGGCSSSTTSTVTIAAAPSVSVNSPTICAGQSATLSANPSVGGGFYSWSPGGQTTQSITVSPASTSNYIVTYSLGGCSNSATSTVTVNAVPTVLVNSPTICAGQSATLTANPSVGGGTYSWSPGGQTSQSITVSPASTLNYVVTYSLGGCSNSATSTVTVNAAPTVSVISPTICAGQSATLSANPSTGGGTYSWSPGGQTSQNITVSPASTSNYIVTYSLGGCSSSTTSIVTVNAAPTVSVNSPTICAGQSATITANPSIGGGTYSWSPGGQTSQSIIVSPASTTNYVVTYSLAGCSNSATSTVTINAAPTVSVNSSTICAGQLATLTATPSMGGGTFSWSPGGQTSQSIIVSPSSTTNYVVTYSLSGCSIPAISTVTVNSFTPAVSITATTTTICSGNPITFNATPTNGGTGPSYQWQVNGSNAGTNSPTFTSSSLANGDQVTVIMTSNASCTATSTATSNAIVITTNTVTPAVSISATSTSICSGSSVTFTATPTNGGTTPIYQWQINGSSAGTSSPTFTSGSLANGDQVTVIMTSNASCTTTSTATSNAIAITTNSVTPAVSISASSTSICSGSSVTFTATPTNGGTTPIYQWQVNGSNAGTNAPTFTSSSLANGDQVTVIMTSNASCTTTSTATSNAITIIASSVTPAVSIAASSTSICSGSSVTFTATPTNGGTTPVYQWQVNGSNVGTNAPTFTSGSLANGDQVTAIMTSNASCTTTSTATSNAIAITTNSVTPAVSISASSTSICSGSSVTFTATPTNGGTTPVYQWQVNGSNAGTNSPTFTSGSLANGDQVTTIMTSNASCTTNSTATSNAIAITTGSVTPAVSIASSSTSICIGSTATFTATPTNGGTMPIYQWQINGLNAGTNSPTFTSGSLANGDQVTAIMTSNASCTTISTATSNAITITTGSVAPAVSIAANSTSICTGSSVTFTATPTNGGTTPIYQWQINGSNAGTNSPTFTHSSLANGDKVTVIMTSNASCTTTSTATSNAITISANSVAPAVSISASSTSICAGSSVTFTATPTNGGTTPIYQWQVNGVNAGTNSATLSTSSLANGDKITAKITSNDPCASPSTATSNAVTITVSAAIQGIRYPSVTALPNNPLQLQARDLGASYSYQWSSAAGLSSSNIQNPVFNYDKKTEYTIRLTSNTGCVTVDTLLVILSNTASVVVPNAWSPNGDGHNDYLYPLTINITQLRYFRVFNRWGQKVFETNIIGKGWDGIFNGRPQATDVYTWALEAVSADGYIYKLTGHAALLR